MIGENPLKAADLDMLGALAPTRTPPMTKVFRQLCDMAQTHSFKAKRGQKVYADSKSRDVEYQVGDQVGINSRHLPGLNVFSKFQHQYRGPFPVTEPIGKVAYRVGFPPTYTCRESFLVSLIAKDRP